MDISQNALFDEEKIVRTHIASEKREAVREANAFSYLQCIDTSLQY